MSNVFDGCGALARAAFPLRVGLLGGAGLAPLPGCGPPWDADPVVSLRSTTGYTLGCLRHHAGRSPGSCGATFGIMRGHLWDHAWMSPASCWVPLGLCGAAFGIMLSGVRGHAGLPLGSAGPPRRAYSPDKFLRGILTAEGMRLTGEPRKVREKGPCPVLRAKRAPWWRFHSRF